VTMNYSKKQNEQIQYLKSAFGADEPTVIDCLKKASWDTDRACDIYLSLPKKATTTAPVKASKKNGRFFY